MTSVNIGVFKEKFAKVTIFGRPSHLCAVAGENVGQRLKVMNSPLLFPSGPRRMVHSSMQPKDSKRRRTSSSDCCLLSMPTKSFLSSKRKRNRSRSEDQVMPFDILHEDTPCSLKQPCAETVRGRFCDNTYSARYSPIHSRFKNTFALH